MSFRIRPLIAADIDSARAVISSYIAELDQSDEGVARFIESQADEDLCTFPQLRKRFFQQNGMMYAMTDRDRLIGLGGVRRISPEVCELRQLYFLRAFRGRGLGEEMVISLIEWAKENDYQAMRLAFSPRQGDAQKLFFKLRFAALEPAKKVWGETPEQLEYELDLRRKRRFDL